MHALNQIREIVFSLDVSSA